MSNAEALLLDFDSESANTRTTLERIPNDKPDFKPHPKSMAFGRLAVHVSTLPQFGITVLTSPDLDLATHQFPRMVFETRDKLLSDFDSLSAELRNILSAATDEQLQQTWKMSFGDKVIAHESRALLYRTMFFNHLIHHRAQLGVYLRLNDLPMPPLYGPTADDSMGF